METGKDELTEARKREIFEALVTAQDQQMSVAESRKSIAEKYKITENTLRQIEREGLDQQWPPL